MTTLVNSYYHKIYLSLIILYLGKVSPFIYMNKLEIKRSFIKSNNIRVKCLLHADVVVLIANKLQVIG